LFVLSLRVRHAAQRLSGAPLELPERSWPNTL
jgi:hypothetical protein